MPGQGDSEVVLGKGTNVGGEVGGAQKIFWGCPSQFGISIKILGNLRGLRLNPSRRK